jgi:hypothetical protein
MTPAEFIDHLRESVRRFGEKTSEMTDEQYAAWKTQVEETELWIEAFIEELPRMVEDLNKVCEAWQRLAGFATCNAGPGGFSVSITYKTLAEAQDAYSALHEIGEVVRKHQEAVK